MAAILQTSFSVYSSPIYLTMQSWPSKIFQPPTWQFFQNCLTHLEYLLWRRNDYSDKADKFKCVQFEAFKMYSKVNSCEIFINLKYKLFITICTHNINKAQQYIKVNIQIFSTLRLKCAQKDILKVYGVHSMFLVEMQNQQVLTS